GLGLGRGWGSGPAAVAEVVGGEVGDGGEDGVRVGTCRPHLDLVTLADTEGGYPGEAPRRDRVGAGGAVGDLDLGIELPHRLDQAAGRPEMEPERVVDSHDDRTVSGDLRCRLALCRLGGGE